MSARLSDDDELARLLEAELRDGAQAGSDDDGPLPADLDELRARIGADLDKTQGPFRRRGAFARAWPVALAALAGAAFTLALSPASLSWALALASWLAGAAGAVALSSILVCPSKPGRGERLARLSLLLGGLALGLQAYGGLAEGGPGLVGSLPGALRCGGVFLVGGAVPLLALGWMLRRSGLPVRRTHAAALAVAAFALSGLGVWRHCAPPNGWHVALAHLALPLAVTAVATTLLFWLLARRRLG